MAPTPTSTSGTQTKRARARRRRGLLGAAILALLLALPLILTRSPVVKLLVLPRVAAKLGASIDASRVLIEPDGTIIATEVRLAAPALPGPAAEILTADRIEISTSWGAILSGSGEFSELTLVRPRLRVSRDAATGAINLDQLTVPVSGTTPGQALPRIVVRDGAIELGEHAPGTYSVLRTLRIEGSMRPTPDPEHLGYALTFAESSVSDPLGRGLSLTGRVTPAGITLTLEGLLLSDWRPENVPEQYRSVFARMRIEGEIPRTAVSIAPDGSTMVRVELDGVSLNLPFDAQGNAAAPDQFVRLSDVTGAIEIDDSGADAILTGHLGDLPSVVRLRFDGLETDAPFHCEIETNGFALSKHPELLPLAPEIVARRLQDFSGPTATVDASVVVHRGEPVAGVPAPIKVEGRLAFHGGTAAFQRFPYVFRQLEGIATFDQDKIDIVKITGIADSGARIEARGVIAPPRMGARVDLAIHVDSVPIDAALLECLGEERRRIVESLFSAERYAALLERGLIRRPGEPGDAPEFALGGVASVDIDIHRPEGENTDYATRILVKLPTAGVIPAPFPLPIIATDVEIAINDAEASIINGRFAGLSGGSAQVAAKIDLDAPEGSDVELSIRATRIPTDGLLLAAIPGGLDGTPGDDSPSALLGRLGVRGHIDCEAEVGPRESGELGYDVQVSFADLTIRPASGAEVTGGSIGLADTVGSLHVTERDLVLSMEASVVAAGQPGAPSGRVSIEGRSEVGEGERRIAAQLAAEVPDITLRAEDLLAVVAPQMAGALAELRAKHAPSGGVSLRAHGRGVLGEQTELSALDVEVFDCRDLAFSTDGGRIRLSSTAGTLSFSALDPSAVEFDGFHTAISADDAPASDAELSGSLPLGRPWAAGDDLRVSVRDARMQSPLIRRLVAQAIPDRLSAAIDASDVVGLFDADLHLVGQRESPTPRVAGEVRPRACQLTLAGQRLLISTIQGGILLDETGGSFNGFRAEGEGWWAEVAGDWVAAGPGAILLDFVVSGQSRDGLTPQVRALLPTGLRESIESVSIDAKGVLAAERIAVRLSIDEVRGTAYRSSGRVTFQNASAETGITVTDAAGYLDFDAESLPGAELGSFGVGLIIDRATAAGIRLRDGALRIASDPRSRMVMIPVLVADAYGGRLTGSAVFRLHEGKPATYDAEFRLSGAPLGELLADWEHAAGIAEAALAELPAPERQSAESRGMVDAGLTLAGIAGAEGDRRGRGVIQIGGGQGTEVLRLPLLLPLIQVSNLQIPQNDRLDFGEAVFFLENDRVVFERVGVFAESVEIFGYGEMVLPEMALDLRLNSRASNRIPMLNELVEKFRNELITTRVEGTVAEPDVSVLQFPRARQIFAAATGRDLTAEERRMLEIERLSRESAQREHRVDRSSRGAVGSDLPE